MKKSMRSILPIRIFRVAERSMEPAINDGAYIIVNCWFSSLKPGDVVIARGEDGIRIVKRIKKLDKGRIFLVGDNLRQSVDSRKFGWIDKGRIYGKMMAVV